MGVISELCRTQDEEFQLSAKRLKAMGQKKLTLEERKVRRRALDDLNLPSFKEFLANQQPTPLAATRKATEILQLNIGLFCNQACNHCHVESSPERQEMMSEAVAARCLALLEGCSSVHTLDLTGGAPEMNAQFEFLVTGARALDSARIEAGLPPLEIIDRCNLTVLAEPGYENLPHFLAKHKVRVVASLPCYSAKNVDTQRGNKVFERSIAGLKALNDVGYGVPGSGLHLDLVYNPLGAFLPPPQAALEAKYKEELHDAFGVSFSQLFTMTNMPIKRFADFLSRRKELSAYLELLVRNFNPDTVPSLMCTNTVSVGWDGQVYDCDFNQQLALTLHNTPTGTTSMNEDSGAAEANGKALDVFSLAALDDLKAVPVSTDSHCFGCTAGMGSS